MDKKRYLFVIRSLTGGGAERVVSILASGLANKGYDVHILVYAVSNDDYKLHSKVNVHILQIPKDNSGLKRKISRSFYIRKFINELKPNIVIPFIGTVVDATFIASRFKKCKFVSTIRNNPAVQPASFLGRLWRNYINFRSDAVFVQNKSQKEYYYKFMHKKIFILPNPISNKFLENNIGEIKEIKNIISVGRLTEQKNQLMLLKAFTIVKEKFPEVKLTIYGEGKLREVLNNKIKELNLNENVILYGRSNDMPNELKKAHLFVMSSDYEGMPNALMEAIAVGIPCISTDCPTGPSDLIVNKKTGYLIPVGDYEKLGKAIIEMINDPQEAQQMANIAKKELISNFSEENIIENFIKLLKEYLKI